MNSLINNIVALALFFSYLTRCFTPCAGTDFVQGTELYLIPFQELSEVRRNKLTGKKTPTLVIC